MTLSALDRTIAPAAKPLSVRPFPAFQQRKLSGGIDVYFVSSGSQPVMEIQLVYKAGLSDEPLSGVAGITASLLSEGTRNLNSLQIAQRLDDYGAFWNADSGYEITGLSISSLSKHARPMIELLGEIALNATLPEEEFLLSIQRKLQNQSVQEKKTAFQARRIFLQKLFGSTHAYGKTIGQEQLKALTLEHLRNYYQSHFHSGNLFIIVAGRFDEDETFKTLNDVFGGFETTFDIDRSQANMAGQAPQSGRYYYGMPGLMQSSVRVGSLAFHRKHPDFNGMRLVNTILGGYFGSRLMSNIREDKGYTYGVSSMWNSLKYGGYFSVGADVGNEFVEDTLTQIRLEINRMQQELVSENELTIAKNYLLGRLIDGLETPFQVADSLKNRLLFDLPSSEFEEALTEIQNMTAEQILSLSQRYFRPNDLLEIVAGKES